VAPLLRKERFWRGALLTRQFPEAPKEAQKRTKRARFA
jgi:hypothetical protein